MSTQARSAGVVQRRVTLETGWSRSLVKQVSASSLDCAALQPTARWLSRRARLCVFGRSARRMMKTYAGMQGLLQPSLMLACQLK